MTMMLEQPCTKCDHDDPECEACWGTGLEGVYVGGNCDNCGRRPSFGCGCQPHHEAAARAHRLTDEHRAGECECFNHRACDRATCRNAGAPRAGYAPFYSHAQIASGEYVIGPDGGIDPASKVH